MSYLSKETQEAFRVTGTKLTTKPVTVFAKRVKKVVPLLPQKGAWRSCDIWFRFEFEDGSTLELSNDFVHNREERMHGGYVVLDSQGCWNFCFADDAANRFVTAD